ncbi:hypothetical protein AVEN_54782-1 [Araneus ventricosus]|uniref:CCHC-type domain-containing protein n=1 Tax=Araneus ventricosus TaxID=182803 RepID=A0A4Y2IWQ9_ARAVE|nr:hypothetical protein AVEN_54782-1 [Araneus ventricosus]
MRNCRRSVCFLLLMDSKLPPRVGRAWRPIRRVVHFGPRCINRMVFQSPGWSAQGDQAKGSLLGLGVKGGHCPRRITIKKSGQNFPTKHLILAFNTHVLPKSVKIAYINCNVKHYIPNPLRCFKCQRFGHALTACRSKQNCARCSLPDHDSNNCSSTTPKCYNCTGEHPAYFKSCPRYKQEKEIQTVKITKNISFPEARKIVNDRNPQPGLSYLAALKPTPMSDKKANSPAENDSIVNLSNQTISSVVQPTVANPTVRNIEPQTNTSTNSSCIANVSEQTLTNSDKPLSNSSSSPVKRITKQSSENKKQEKKSNEWVKVKETKAAKRARLLAEKRYQVFSHSLPNRSPSREDFLKDSVTEGKNNDDDSLLKVYPSDDDMSTGEVEDLLLSP